MVNGIQEKGMNKESNMIIKIRKYPGASSTDILDHIKPSLRKDPDQILIHAGTNDLTNDQNYLKNVKKIVKLVRETCKDTKLCFSSLICHTDVPDIDEKVSKTNTNLENYCNQQNIGFISNNNIKKSDLNARGLHLHERGSSKLAKKFLDYLYRIYETGSRFPDEFEKNDTGIIKKLKENKLSHPKCVSLGYPNINSVRNKFFSIPHLIDNNIDICTIAETKLDSSFPDSQFLVPGMKKPFRLDVTSRKGGLLVFVNNDIPCKYLRNFHLPRDTQAIPIEINLNQRKLLVVSIYRPPDQNLDYFLSSITSLLDHYLTIYKDFVIMGDFNVNESNPVMETFLNQHNCKNINKNKTCYKSLEGSCIDLIITSRPSLHQFSQVFETGMSDHHSMIYTMLKSTYTRLEPKNLRNRSYKDFYEECFLQDLQHGLSNNGNYSDFNNEFKEILNHHAPIKQTKVRGNTKPDINKALRKEIMKRSRLKNKANKSGKEDDKRLYKIQRNKVTKLNNKLKKTYFKQKLPKGNNVKDFWNYCKPYFTNKGICNDDRIILNENNEILNKDSDISETFNKYFVNLTKDLGIFDWGDGSFDHLNIFQRISAFDNHPSIQLIKNKYQNTFKFKFKPVTTEQIITFIDEIDCNKSSSGEIPAKIIKMAKEEV